MWGPKLFMIIMLLLCLLFHGCLYFPPDLLLFCCCCCFVFLVWFGCLLCFAFYWFLIGQFTVQMIVCVITWCNNWLVGGWLFLFFFFFLWVQYCSYLSLRWQQKFYWINPATTTRIRTQTSHLTTDVAQFGAYWAIARLKHPRSGVGARPLRSTNFHRQQKLKNWEGNAVISHPRGDERARFFFLGIFLDVSRQQGARNSIEAIIIIVWR